MTINNKIRIITTVGTSLLSNFFHFSDSHKGKKKEWWDKLQEENGIKIHFSDQSWKEWETKWKGLKDNSFPNEVKNWVKTNKKKPQEKSCAELQSIRQIADGYDEVEVILLSSYTLDGYLAATIIKGLLEDETVLGFKFTVVLEQPIEGLVVDKADLFIEKGADNIIQIVTDEIYKRDLSNEVYRLLKKGGKNELKHRLGKNWFKSDITKHFFKGNNTQIDTFIKELQNAGTNDKAVFYADILNNHDTFGKVFNTDLVFNISGGYKGVIPILTIIGQIYANVELKYLYEESNGIITIPKMPVQFDWDTMRIYGQYLEDAKISSLEIDDRDIFEKMKSLSLIDTNNKISITGKILQRYLKNNTPMDSSVIGDYFEYIVYEEVVKIALKQTDKNNIALLEKGFEPDYLKKNKPNELGDIDVIAEFKNDSSTTTFMLEAKSVFQIVDDLDKVMEKVINRLKKWREQSENIDKKVVIVLCVWHFPKDNTIEKAKELLEKYKIPDGTIAEFNFTLCQIEFSTNESLSENNNNQIFRKTEINLQSIFN